MFSAMPRNFDGTRMRGRIEVEYNSTKNGPRITAYKQYLPAGKLKGGGRRKHALVQFWCDPGGLRTVIAEDIVLV